MLFKKALYFAAEKHDGQYRKGGKTPFIVHPVMVAFEVQKYTNNEEVISAAFLHDVVEDCNISINELSKKFGKNVSKIVKELSFLAPKTSKKDKWCAKKQKYLNLISCASRETLLIVAADKFLNMKAYFDFILNGGNLKILNKTFGGTINEYFWYYEEVLKILKPSLKNYTIIKKYKTVLDFYRKKL
jgi:(p)ppGpp synthase/HD superfamily hydrolase